MTYEIGGKFFSSKSTISTYAKEILKKSELGKVLTGEDKHFIFGLIECHPNATEKIGAGIKHIIARVDPVWKKGKQFLIIRVDGSVIDFSYKKCIYGEMSAKDLFKCACRTAVVDDIIAFKNTHLSPESICPYFGYPLTRENAHVDHVQPMTFNAIVDDFMKIHGPLDGATVIGETQKRFEAKWITDKFLEFHRKTAILELVSEQANQTCCKVKWKEPAEAGHKIQSRMEP